MRGEEVRKGECEAEELHKPNKTKGESVTTLMKS